MVGFLGFLKDETSLSRLKLFQAKRNLKELEKKPENSKTFAQPVRQKMQRALADHGIDTAVYFKVRKMKDD